MKEIWCFTEHD